MDNQQTQNKRALLTIAILAVFLVAVGIAAAAYRYNKPATTTRMTSTPTMTIATSTTAMTQTATITPTASVTVSNTNEFKILSVDMSVNPNSIAHMTCGSNTTITYTATFHAPANTTGGKVDFTYTTTNGRGTTPASVTFNPGETEKIYTFTWSGTLASDNVNPGEGGVMVTSPNSLTSSMVKPTGMCY